MRVDCPECGSVLHLQADLAGKNLACPVCREVFAIPAEVPAEPLLELLPDAVEPLLVADSVEEPKLELIVESEGFAADDLIPPDDFDPPIELRTPFRPAEPIRDSGGLRPPLVEIELEEEGPKVVAWTAKMAPPPAQVAESRPAPAAVSVSIGEVYGLKRKRRGSRRPLLIVLSLFCIVALAVGGVFWAGLLKQGPDKLLAKARAAYDKQSYEAARQDFEKLVAEHADHPGAGEARFLGRVAKWRAIVASPVNRANPQPALEDWKKLDRELAEPEFKALVAPEKFAGDVWGGLQKLQEDVVAHAKDELKPDDSSEAERWLAVGEGLTASLNKYRAKNVALGEGVTDPKPLQALIAKTKARLAALAGGRELLAADDASALPKARKLFGDAGLSDDPAARELIAAAETRLRERTRYVVLESPLLARRIDASRSAGVLPTRGLTPEAKPAGRVGFFQSGGLLAAFDVGDGSIRWTDEADPDDGETPLELAATDERPESVAYLARRGGKPALCVRDLAGGLVWEHDLSKFEPRGRPLAVADSLMLAVFDPSRPGLGLVARFDRLSGSLRGVVEFGRPVANTGAHRPGSTLWAVPAESDDLLVFKVAEADGVPAEPTVVASVPVGHSRGSVSGPPILGGGDADPEFAILPVREGAAVTNLIPVALAGGTPPGRPIALQGWVSRPTAFDGETALIATDAGRVYRVGVGLPGGPESSAFLEAEPYVVPRVDDRPAPCRVVATSAGSAAVFDGDSLHLLRSRLGTRGGPAFAPAGQPESVGELVGPASGPGGVFALTRSAPGQAARLAAFDPSTGAKLWERQIGLGVLARGAVSGRTRWFDSEARLLDLDGPAAGIAISARPPTLEPVPLRGWPAESRPVSALFRGDELIAVASSPGGWRIVTGPVRDGAIVAKTLNLPFAPVGPLADPAGTVVYLPLADGAIHRIDLATGQSQPGPAWEGRAPQVFTVSPDRFVAAASGRLTLWGWSPERESADRLRHVPFAGDLARLNLARPGAEVLLFGIDPAGGVAAWDLRKFKRIGSWEAAGVRAVVPLPGGQDVLVATASGSSVHAARTGEARESPLPADRPLAFVDGANGRLVAVGGDGRVWTADASGWRENSTRVPASALARIDSITPFDAGLILEASDGTVAWLEPAAPAEPEKAP